VNVVRLDPEGHARVQSLLPWFVTGRLDEAERSEVEQHLGGCARCRAELALERQLRSAHTADAEPADEAAADRGFARLQRRIVSERKPPPRRRRFEFVWWRWALGAQFAAILLLAGTLAWLPRDGALYHGLGAAAGAPGANAVVMFKADATEAQIRQALRAVDGRLVGGPTTTQAYLLALPVADAEALARLRTQPAVSLAESLAAGDGR
jgi:anti-sigma factor RsiW